MADDMQTKQEIRETARARRRALTGKDELSRCILDTLLNLHEYQSAQTVMFYVDARGEVRTRDVILRALQAGKRVVIPYCVEGELELFILQDIDELTTGMYNIPEPRPELRQLPDRKASAEELDLIVVPGVAFDIHGARCGQGLGYYDKLLNRVPPETPLVGLAFDCQVFSEIPVETHDVFMDQVVTETMIHSKK